MLHMTQTLSPVTTRNQQGPCILHTIPYFLSASVLRRQHSYLRAARRQIELLCKARQKRRHRQVEAGGRGDHYLAEAHAIVESLGGSTARRGITMRHDTAGDLPWHPPEELGGPDQSLP